MLGLKRKRKGMQKFKLACPSCNKTFSLKWEDLQNSNMQFQCPSCQNVFWANKKIIENDSLIAFSSEFLLNQKIQRISELENSYMANPSLSKNEQLKTGSSAKDSFAEENAAKAFGSHSNSNTNKEVFASIQRNTNGVTEPSSPSLNHQSIVVEAKCPSCGAKRSPGLSECPACGVIFAKLNQKMSSASSAGSSISNAGEALNNQWKQVMEAYEDLSRHEAFIQACMIQSKLAFASQQYRKLLELNPQDTMAQKMRDKIINLATVSFIPPSRSFEDKGRKSSALIFIIGIVLLIVGGFSQMMPVVLLGGGLLVTGFIVRIMGRK